eukprot:TRINITY_DN11460_c0_g1_i2.p1 TRINITY_DN11460_c0_g1~~TRINITY_DN11460_c0_g1_i2.p1  ORF type:complete len:1379 (-),score=227.92 TRINITY_DN11460_c0_g1_i2:48-4184(-)
MLRGNALRNAQNALRRDAQDFASVSGTVEEARPADPGIVGGSPPMEGGWAMSPRETSGGTTWYVMDADAWWGARRSSPRAGQRDEGQPSEAVEEAPAVQEAPTPSTPVPVKALFDALDENHDGVISRAEFNRALGAKEKLSSTASTTFLSPQKPSTPSRGTLSARQKVATLTLRSVDSGGCGTGSGKSSASGKDGMTQNSQDWPSDAAESWTSTRKTRVEPRDAWGLGVDEAAETLQPAEGAPESLRCMVGCHSSGGGTGSCAASPSWRARSPPPNGGSGSCGSGLLSPGRSSRAQLSPPRSLSPRARSPDACSAAAGRPALDSEGMPPVAVRLMEAVVEEEVAGLGECLSICSQRSRTLKLLGFQHLHFDARLQGFLEERAAAVMRPVADALLLARGLLAFREAARHRYLWQRLGDSQRQLRSSTAQAATYVHKAQGAAVRRGGLTESDRLRALRILLSAWQSSVLEDKYGGLSRRYEKISADLVHELSVKKATCLKRVKERIANFFRTALHLGFTGWVHHMENRHQLDKRKEILAQAIVFRDDVVIEKCLLSWRSFSHEAKREREKVRDASWLVRQGWLDGAYLFSVFDAWQMVKVRRIQHERLRAKVIQELASEVHSHEDSFFRAWVAVTKASSAQKQQRMQSVMKMACLRSTSSVESAWAHWHECYVESKQRRRVKRDELHHISARNRSFAGTVLLAWSREVVRSKHEILLRIMYGEHSGSEVASWIVPRMRLSVGTRSQKLASLWNTWVAAVASKRRKLKRQDEAVQQIRLKGRAHCAYVLQAWQGAHWRLCSERQAASIFELKTSHVKLLFHMKGTVSLAFHTWVQGAVLVREHRVRRTDARIHAERAALQAFDDCKQSVAKICFESWVRVAMVHKVQSRQELLVSSTLRQLQTSRSKLLRAAFGSWLRGKAQRTKLEPLSFLSWRRRTRDLLRDCLTAWHDDHIHERMRHLQAALNKEEAQMDSVRSRNERLLTSLLGQGAPLKGQMGGGAKKITGASVCAHMLLKSLVAKAVDVLKSWARYANVEKARRRQEGYREATIRHLSYARCQCLVACVAAWRSLLEACRLSRRRRRQNHAIVRHRIADARETLLQLTFAALHIEVVEARLRRRGKEKMRQFCAKAVRQFEFNYGMRAFLCWRELCLVNHAVQRERRRLGRVASLGRAHAVKARGRMLEIRCLYRWLLACHIKQPWPEKYGTSTFFNTPQPAFFVKPLKDSAPVQQKIDFDRKQPDTPGSPRSKVMIRPITTLPNSETIQVYMTPQPAPKADVPEVCLEGLTGGTPKQAAALSVPEPSRPSSRSSSRSPTRFMVTSGTSAQLAPSERYALASQAATNDGEYQRLLAHNRREIRENRDTVRRGSPERVVGWGVLAS